MLQGWHVKHAAEEAGGAGCGHLQAHMCPTQRILIWSFIDQNCSCGPHDNTYVTYMVI